MTDISESRNIHKTALLVSLACVLQISESLIPHPVPGLRLGLANAVTLIALVDMGFRYALEITLLRALLSSFIMGTFMSPAFILSFLSGIVSTSVMGFFYFCHSWFRPSAGVYAGRSGLSIVGVSVLGALSHNLFQLYLAYLILVRHTGIFVFLPWLCVGAVVTGWLTGVLSGQICLKIRQMRESGLKAGPIMLNQSCSVASYYFAGDSILHRLPAELKIAAIFVLSLLVFIFNNFWLSLGLSLFWAGLVIISQSSFRFIFSRMKKYSFFIFVSFLFPLCFNSGNHISSHTPYFTLTAESINTVAFFAWRVVFLILISSLLVMVTPPQDLGRGLANLLSPLKPIGISKERTAVILSLSWAVVPVFWETAKNVFRGGDFKKIKNPLKLMLYFSDFIATLYLQAEQIIPFSL